MLDLRRVLHLLCNQGADVPVPHVASRLPTLRRPRPAACSWPACCSRWAPTASCGSACRSCRMPPTSLRPMSSGCPRSASSTADSPRWPRATSRSSSPIPRVGHMGFATLGIFALSTSGIEGATLVMINHGVTTGALFIAVGIIYERLHTPRPFRGRRPRQVHADLRVLPRRVLPLLARLPRHQQFHRRIPCAERRVRRFAGPGRLRRAGRGASPRPTFFACSSASPLAAPATPIITTSRT